MNDSAARIFAAAFVSPLSILVAVPLGLVAASIWNGVFPDLPAAIGFAVLLLYFAYPTMLVFGVPSYLLLRQLNLDRFWSAAASGLLAAILVPLLLQFLSGMSIARDGIPPSIAYANFNALLSQPALLFSPLTLLGPIVGIVFWLVASYRPDRRIDI